ncbi:hypothetical protein [Pedobacter hiemivivus]|uniref:GLPGLI family protein n=1 Tax=Pedobacter hiemivivus TaxID=2530454 RepID=A0A4R0ML92_9SPHI|nr:hypothetical protein [Pedobacter hiemivivus]TCC87429.1 hypothetical protein EZ444_22650 [Pedobacter hiemivivus]
MQRSIQTKVRCIALVILMHSSLSILASPQLPDYIIYKNDTIATYNLLVEQYLQKYEHVDREQLFGLSFRDGGSFNCWRGYQAIYKIENDSLFLADIIDCGSLRKTLLDKSTSIKKMQAIFRDRLTNGKVFISWFSGDLNFPLTNKIVRWDGVFSTIYEKEKILHISNGNVSNIENINNYVDDPKAINREYKVKIPDILFEKLKRIKWKASDDCDCSEKYLITIDEYGKISKINMLRYELEEKIDRQERKEYDYCTSTMLKALKSLRFDIIKNKGKPISEDVYLEIWIEESGEIKNWTN